jgi:small subunit ribosomal protein S3Ae
VTIDVQASQAKQIRKRMTDIMVREAETCDLKELVAKFIPESIGREIEKACQGIYPLQNVFIRKAKILRAPKFDITKLMEVHQGGDTSAGNAVGDRLDRPDLIPEAEAPAEIEGAY